MGYLLKETELGSLLTREILEEWIVERLHHRFDQPIEIVVSDPPPRVVPL
jgi:hypothetical protein